MDRRLKVELFEEIRREYEFGVGTIKGVAKKLGVHGEFIRSRGDRRLVKAATVLPPPVRHKIHRLFLDTGFWRPSLQSGMRPIAVEIISEREKLCLQVGRRPE